MNPSRPESIADHWLRLYAKFVCASILFLIFLGGLVKSTESGLSVPDWPTTYGHFMFSFPLDQMVGGIKYEHSHRMVASVVGLMTLVLTLWLFKSSAAPWLKKLGVAAFVMVVLQGVLGGLTVIHFLPFWLSSLHGTIAQIYFLLVIMIAYALSKEYKDRRGQDYHPADGRFIRMAIIFTAMILIQLVIGNVLRHTESGLAVPDFPTMGGTLIPTFNSAMMERINAWRFEHNYDTVSMGQVHIHILHRFWALLILLKLIYLNMLVYKDFLNRPLILKTMFLLNATVLIQIMLGIATVLSMKEVYTTTFHVTVGAITLGLGFLLVLRSSPLSWKDYCKKLSKAVAV